MNKVKTNPNKSNQYKPDPRQAEFLSLYFNPSSKTYSKLVDSLVAAGYSEEYAKSFQRKARTWLQESTSQITKDELVKKAKVVLDRSLSSKDEKIAQDTAKFIAKTDIEFSEKTQTEIVLPKPIMEIENVRRDNSD